MPLVPIVVEQTPRGVEQYDIWSRLMKDRIVFIGDGIGFYGVITPVKQPCFAVFQVFSVQFHILSKLARSWLETANNMANPWPSV